MILVSGATGQLGGSVARDLLGRGQAVRVLLRPDTDGSAFEAAGAEIARGDLKDPPSLAAACAGVQTVITTANSAARGGLDDVEAVDRRGNRALIDAAAAAGVAHFVFVSALGAAEDSPVDFLRAKGESERRVRESGMSYTILEPNLFMDVWVAMLIGMPLQQGQPVTLVHPATHRHTFIALRDVSAFTVAAALDPAARNRLLVLGGPQALSWTEAVQVAEQVTGRAIEVRHIAPGEPLPGLPEVVAALAASFETYESVFDTRPLAAEFGVRLTELREFLTRMLGVEAQPGG